MIWQEPTADLARARQQALLDDAAARRFALQSASRTPRCREWLARQLVLLALRIAPSLQGSLASFGDRPRAAARFKPSVNGASLALLF